MRRHQARRRGAETAGGCPWTCPQTYTYQKTLPALDRHLNQCIFHFLIHMPGGRDPRHYRRASAPGTFSPARSQDGAEAPGRLKRQSVHGACPGQVPFQISSFATIWGQQATSAVTVLFRIQDLNWGQNTTRYKTFPNYEPIPHIGEASSRKLSLAPRKAGTDTRTNILVVGSLFHLQTIKSSTLGISPQLPTTVRYPFRYTGSSVLTNFGWLRSS